MSLTKGGGVDTKTGLTLMCTDPPHWPPNAKAHLLAFSTKANKGILSKVLLYDKMTVDFFTQCCVLPIRTIHGIDRPAQAMKLPLIVSFDIDCCFNGLHL